MVSGILWPPGHTDVQCPLSFPGLVRDEGIGGRGVGKVLIYKLENLNSNSGYYIVVQLPVQCKVKKPLPTESEGSPVRVRLDNCTGTLFIERLIAPSIFENLGGLVFTSESAAVLQRACLFCPH